MTHPHDDWPKTAYGTVNWEVVFEHPNDGFIAIVESAATPLDLKRSTLEIVNQLFPRTVDGGEIDRFIDEFENLIPNNTPDAHLPVLQDAVTDILRDVKEARVKRARAYELSEMELEGNLPPEEVEDIFAATEVDRRKVASAGTAAKRQAGTAAKRQAGTAAREQVKPSALFGIGGKRLSVVAGTGVCVCAAVVIAAVFFVANPLARTSKTSEISKASEIAKSANHVQSSGMLETFIAELEQASVDKTTKIHSFGGILSVSTADGRITVTASEVPHAICTGASRMLIGTGTIIINGKFSQQMRMDQIEQLCRRPGGRAQLAWRPKPT